LKGAVSGTERAREREMALEDASRPRDIDRERGEQHMRERREGCPMGKWKDGQAKRRKRERVQVFLVR
jgi:hypothetical protein